MPSFLGIAERNARSCSSSELTIDGLLEKLFGITV